MIRLAWKENKWWRMGKHGFSACCEGHPVSFTTKVWSNGRGKKKRLPESTDDEPIYEYVNYANQAEDPDWEDRIRDIHKGHIPASWYILCVICERCETARKAGLVW